MKRILGILTCVLLTTGAGYEGTLPDLAGEFEYKKNAPETSTTIFTPVENQKQDELKPIPRDNKTYLEIIINKDKSNQYVKETNEVITILEKLKNCIETDKDIQKFNAIVSNFIDNVSYIQTKYMDKPESAYISYKNMVSLSDQARKIAILRTESQVYTKYLPYSSSGSVYKQQNIDKQLSKLLGSVNQTLYVLKNLD